MSVFKHTAVTFKSGSMTVPGYYYTSEDILEAELESIFYDRWLCVGREEHVLNAGDYIVAKIGNENLIVLRDLDGELRAFYNLCRHRGTVICTEAKGRYADCIRCPYHGWAYDLKGRLIAAPFMDELSNFERADYPLHSVAVYCWEGFLFLNLASRPQSFATEFMSLRNRFQQWQLSNLRVARRIEYEVHSNWKIIVENYLECYHCPMIHHDFVRKIHYRSGKNDLSEGPVLGGFMEFKEGIASLTQDGLRCAPPLGTIFGDDLSRVYFYSIFPNLTLSIHPDYVMSFNVLPVTCAKTKVIVEWLFAAEALQEGKCNPDAAVRFWDNANNEDWKVCELLQEGVKSRCYRPSPYSNTESLPIAFMQEVLKGLDQNNFVCLDD
jgi:Rieske 2Fe-2S family protein